MITYTLPIIFLSFGLMLLAFYVRHELKEIYLHLNELNVILCDLDERIRELNKITLHS